LFLKRLELEIQGIIILNGRNGHSKLGVPKMVDSKIVTILVSKHCEKPITYSYKNLFRTWYLMHLYRFSHIFQQLFEKGGFGNQPFLRTTVLGN